MLTWLRISNFAIIDELELELGPGLTVLTGETGAGKSILVDALGLALGDRADAGVVRHGTKRAEISVGFNVEPLPGVREWLAGQMLDEDDECHVRRVIAAEGRSRAYVNGQQVPLATLRELGERLVDIHGQHEHQSLMRSATQRHLLDHHGGLLELAARTAEAFRAWHAAREALAEATDAQANRADREALLRHQITELEAHAPTPEALAELEAEHGRLRHSGRLAEGTAEALALLYEGEDTAQARIALALRRLDALTDLDPSLAEPHARLEEAEIQLREAADALRRYGDGLDMDPQRAADVEERLATIRALARKNRAEPSDLHELLDQLQLELEALDGAGSRLEGLETEVAETRVAFEKLATDLHSKRGRAAKRFGKAVTDAMQTLGMAGGRFEVSIDALAPDDARAHGLDQVAFMVSANPGQPLQPLARVASGGELSRISLAIQVIAAGASEIPCMVFDEVDSGVGGGVAEIVGRRLRALAGSRQVLCVTHLPQVACQGHAHLRVSKQTDGKHTRTVMATLDEVAKVEELARMLGGVEITDRTRAHAAEMRSQAAG